MSGDGDIAALWEALRKGDDDRVRELLLLRMKESGWAWANWLRLRWLCYGIVTEAVLEALGEALK